MSQQVRLQLRHLALRLHRLRQQLRVEVQQDKDESAGESAA
jgi:hypothetical protein